MRHIIHSKNQEPVWGITIPKDVALFFSGVYMSIERCNIGSKVGIFLESGLSPYVTEKEVEEFEFPDQE